MNKTAPIGIFDSGIGGLTVVKKTISLFPNENIIYFGDTARVPYGSKSNSTVIEYSHQNAEFLINKGKEGNAVVKLSYKNTGNSHTVLSPKLSIFTVNNEKINDIDMPRIKALPGDTVIVEEEYKIASGSRAEVYITLDGKTLKKNTKIPPK